VRVVCQISAPGPRRPGQQKKEFLQSRDGAVGAVKNPTYSQNVEWDELFER
jgi:hypothetical protein